MNAPTLFDSDADLLSRTTDPDTSREAAESQVKNLTTLQTIVRGIFENADFGLTDSELDRTYAHNAERRGYPNVRFETPRKRRSDLSRMGVLVDSGVRRLNSFGRPEVVWWLA